MARQSKKEKDNQNKDVSLELLNSIRNALYAVKKFMDSAVIKLAEIDDVDTQLKIQKAILESAAKIGPAIEGIDKLEEKVKRDEKANISRRGQNETSIFEDPKE